MDTVTTADGETLFVDRDDRERGSKGPFYAVYSSEDRAERWGYQCSNCETFDNAVDSMGRIVCNECENTHKPDEWDAVQG